MALSRASSGVPVPEQSHPSGQERGPLSLRLCFTRARVQIGKGHFSICHGTSRGGACTRAGEASPLPASQMPPAPKDALDFADLELERLWAEHEALQPELAGNFLASGS